MGAACLPTVVAQAVFVSASCKAAHWPGEESWCSYPDSQEDRPVQGQTLILHDVCCLVAALLVSHTCNVLYEMLPASPGQTATVPGASKRCTAETAHHICP